MLDAPKATVSGGPFTSLVHLHGALFTAWVVLFIVQTALIASHRVAVHRRLGVAGAMLAAAMVIVGTTVGIATAARGAAPPGVEPLAFLAIPIFDIGAAAADDLGHRRLARLRGVPDEIVLARRDAAQRRSSRRTGKPIHST